MEMLFWPMFYLFHGSEVFACTTYGLRHSHCTCTNLMLCISMCHTATHAHTQYLYLSNSCECRNRGLQNLHTNTIWCLEIFRMANSCSFSTGTKYDTSLVLIHVQISAFWVADSANLIGNAN